MRTVTSAVWRRSLRPSYLSWTTLSVIRRFFQSNHFFLFETYAQGFVLVERHLLQQLLRQLVAGRWQTSPLARALYRGISSKAVGLDYSPPYLS